MKNTSTIILALSLLSSCQETHSSIEAVAKQKTDVPYDSESPLFTFGFGLSYEK